MVKACAVPNCNKLHKAKRSMFRVPSDEAERKKWADAIPEIKNLKSSHFVCELHFDEAFILRKYEKHDENGRLIAEHVYQRPRLYPSATPNTPAKVGSLPLTVDLGNTASVSTDTQSCAVSELLSTHAEECASSGSGDSPEPLPGDPESSDSIMQFPEDHRYCALPILGNHVSSSSSSMVPQTCASNTLSSIAPMHSASPAPRPAGLQNRISTVVVSLDDRKFASTVPDLTRRGISASSLQSSLYFPITGIEPSPMDVDVEAVESPSHGSSKIVKLLEKSIDVGARKTSEEKPRNEPSAPNFKKLKISPASLSLEASSTLTIPKSWTVSEVETKCGKKMIFSIIIMVPVDDGTPVVKKSVTLNLWDGQIYYFVHGKLLNLTPDRPPLVPVLDKVESLPKILLNFGHMRVCGGLKPIDNFLMKDDGTKDALNYWRGNNCLLLAKNKRCAECKRVQKVWKQRQARYAKNPVVIRVRHAPNSQDQTQINVLRKKLIQQRRMKNRVEHRLKVLNEELEKNRKDLAAIQNMSFEDKCQELNLSGTQKMVVQEIIAAAKTKGRGRRYSEKWLMLCRLMNVRSPGYYEFLRENDIIPLPSRKTIHNFAANKDKAECHKLQVLDKMNPKKNVGDPANDSRDAIVDFGDDVLCNEVQTN